MTSVHREVPCPSRRASSHRVAAWTGRLGLLAATLLAAVAAAPSAATAAECPNEAIRTQQSSTYLPECRAYELVSPSGSVPVFKLGNGLATIAAAEGGRVAYGSQYTYPTEPSESVFLLATRGETGWSVQPVTPPQGGVNNTELFECNPWEFYSRNLSLGVLADGVKEGSAYCEGDSPPLVAGEARGVTNLFFHDNESGSYRLITQVPTGVTPENALFEDATPDLSHVLFTDESQLMASAPAGRVLYEWAAGQLRVVSVLPSGQATTGAVASQKATGREGVYNAPLIHAVSEDGERVFFYSGGNLYARLNAMQEPTTTGECEAAEPANACTVQIDRAEAGAGPSGGGIFLDASANGERVFFMDGKRLTTNATAQSGEPDLYEYDLETGTLTDLTVNTTEPANVRGFSGASEDGSYVYFVATGVLSGEAANSQGAKAQAGRANLYALHENQISFVATIAGGMGYEDASDWQEQESTQYHQANTMLLAARTSPNGQYIAFNSTEELTGYDNGGAEPGDCGYKSTVVGLPCNEVFLYDANEARLSCVSCAAGARPTANTTLGEAGGENTGDTKVPYLARNVLNTGQVFFESADALLPQAANGEVNVYEYRSGNLTLISSGVAAGPANFMDASENGEDVFFMTGKGLVSTDTDGSASLYDARVNGGFVAQDEKIEVPRCTSVEGCRAPLSEAPAEAFAASSAFAGPGDLSPVVAPPAKPPAGSQGNHRQQVTRAQKLRRALKRCARKSSRRKRRVCRRDARHRFGGKSGRRRKSRHATHSHHKRAGRHHGRKRGGRR